METLQSLELELSSIFEFILKAADNPLPYYEYVPESFYVPAAYFPVPEIVTYGDTFSTYSAEYSWYVTFFHSSSQEAYILASKALTAIKESRNVIPLLDENGSITGRGIRIKDPELKPIDQCAVRLLIRFISHRPYKDPESIRMRINKILIRIKGGHHGKRNG